MPQDSFSRCHPAANFLFFVAVIGLGVTIQHPAYAIAGLIGASVYYLLLKGKKGVSFIGSMAGMMVLITVLNPLINTSGKHTLFLLFGRPYTAEAMAYGAVLGLIFALTMVWFGCYSEVLTSDKFTALFGNLIPALSLLLVMVLRLIPAFTRKTTPASVCSTAVMHSSCPNSSGRGALTTINSKSDSSILRRASAPLGMIVGRVYPSSASRAEMYSLELAPALTIRARPI